jgi:alpha-beta hydrolase superfamily lysophospholipase
VPRPIQLLFVSVTLYAGVSLVAGVVLAETALRPARHVVTAADVTEAQAIATRWKSHVEDATIESADGVTLRGWFFPSPASPSATVLVTHGVSGHRGHALALASLLLGHGYAVLAPDARGHGASEGVASFGVRERDDLHRWVDWIAAHHGGSHDPQRCVVGVGASMGAAQLIQAVDDRIRAIRDRIA